MASPLSTDRGRLSLSSPTQPADAGVADAALPAQAEAPQATLKRLLTETDDPQELFRILLPGVPELDLSRLTESQARSVMELRPEVWALLQSCGRFTHVVLGAGMPVNRLLAGLKELTTMTTLQVPAAQSGARIDLRSLQGEGVAFE